MNKQAFVKLFAKVKEIEEFVKENKYDGYTYVYSRVEEMVYDLEKFAKENGLPFKVNVDEMIDKHWDGYYEEEESSSYYEYEEKSSSYYEYEEESSYY